MPTQFYSGHDDIEGIERADKLAKEAGKLWAPTFHTFTHTKRQAKAKAPDDWKKEHARRTPRGGFALADGQPSRWKDTTSITPQEKSTDDSYTAVPDMLSSVNTTPNSYQQNQFSAPAVLVINSRSHHPNLRNIRQLSRLSMGCMI
ncbi:uncharacterized protein C8R40DRAFT_1165112 [Lentinula edodes]|uniref:uncharacterized protein n=1 Tax=Lentinula edodes TaxID=5353 RepID=UPI001E8CCB81|nr:uncharacterized protein C8R40DRAFT_1165112 [Lentinula edodes]KAH7880208.1 hypothetical protein C8R40DRAFT_1165112 [Lentinula edodes]